ncbi:hypothetical protein D5S17_33120 [Pseudonocardiaceae bacterium YIM PH 21723]|nr:hypothetical protein D5S17_33120 [Pseudonocardiaceae bacterium YIM PH 21723]
MNQLEAALRRVAIDLDSRQRSWALVGGFAVSARAVPRFTQEIVPDLVLPVASTGHLIALKILARADVTRPQDLADLRGLLEAATPEDIEVARGAARLITERGFHRDRDLLTSLDELLAVFKAGGR